MQFGWFVWGSPNPETLTPCLGIHVGCVFGWSSLKARQRTTRNSPGNRGYCLVKGIRFKGLGFRL